MDLVSSFAILLQSMAITMTAPSFHNFVSILTGWVFARRRTVTGMLMAAGLAFLYMVARPGIEMGRGCIRALRWSAAGRLQCAGRARLMTRLGSIDKSQ